MAPKNLLHHKECKSNLTEFDDVQGHPGLDKQLTRFNRLLNDQSGHSDLEEGIRRLVLCSGKIYYELDEKSRSAESKDVAICRVEQLCPFPYDLIQSELKRYPKAGGVVLAEGAPLIHLLLTGVAKHLPVEIHEKIDIRRMRRVANSVGVVADHDSEWVR